MLRPSAEESRGGSRFWIDSGACALGARSARVVFEPAEISGQTRCATCASIAIKERCEALW